MRRSYVDYAMSVIIGAPCRCAGRPEAVHRRILFGMRDMGLASNRAYRKCAKIVGEVMGNYHPHATVRSTMRWSAMAQDFSYRYTLVDGQGNFDPSMAIHRPQCGTPKRA